MLEKECAHHVDCDHRLAGPWTALDEQDRLPAVVKSGTGTGEDLLEDDQLLIEQNVLRLATDHAADVLHEVLARPVLALLDACQHGQPIALLELRKEMLREPVGVVAREEWVARDQLAKAIREEHIVGIRKVVVEVRASPETDRVVPLIEGRVGLLEIELVLTDLRGGVQHLALRAADTRRHEPLADRLPAPLPLLELDD